jgi:hypothetical protein
MQAHAHGMSIVGIISHKPVFEGHANSIQRADGTVEESDFHSASGEAIVPVEAIKSGSLEAVFTALLPVSTQVGASMAMSMYDTIEAGIRSVGNEVNAAGKPLTADLILDAFEKVLVDFDENGLPRWPTMVVHPSQTAHLQAELARAESDSALVERLRKITERKREEWHAREASRVLVG